MRTTIALSLILTASPALAGVYKCTDDRGRVTFSQTPCGHSAETVDVRVHTPSGKNVSLVRTATDAGSLRLATNELNRKIARKKREIDDLQDEMDTKLTILKAKKYRARNNLPGAVWLDSISGEMQAVTEQYKAKISICTDELEQLRSDLSALDQ